MIFSIYYVCDEDRVDAIRTFSINKRFRWSEQGVSMASWIYNKIAKVEKNSINEVKKQFSELSFDKRHRTFRRTMNIGDVITCENEILVYTPIGWLRVPSVIWEKVQKK